MDKSSDLQHLEMTGPKEKLRTTGKRTEGWSSVICGNSDKSCPGSRHSNSDQPGRASEKTLPDDFLSFKRPIE